MLNKETVDAASKFEYAAAVMEQIVAGATPTERKQLQADIERGLFETIKTKHPKIHHHLLQRLEVELHKLLQQRHFVAANPVNVDYRWYVSYKVIPTRNKRRQKRRFVEFTDQKGKVHKDRYTCQTPAEFHNWCNRQLGEQAGRLNVDIRIVPMFSMQTYHLVVEKEKAAR